ncbi:hypothetical protein [Paenibacillus sp. R14(2021)]|uniref:hypothetical protein n=1 Tax=Paenibacillus sp. R14(2021) TaxID=2859228 RepID=UPI001C6167A6|nr:hypothetical protein [Paenibacillus sp. R14(2021)]
MDFNSIYFHDSELKEIKYDWNSFTLNLILNIFIDGPRKPFQQSILKFTECTLFEVPHNAPWGDSFYINGANQLLSADQEMSTYEIEMQSGDIIKINARRFELLVNVD